MANWKMLCLSKQDGHPALGQLVALQKVSKGGKACAYDIGYLDHDPRSQSRKLWWYGTRGCENIAELNKRCDIWWLPIAIREEVKN